MRRILMRSKIHRAHVTAADPDYVGSLTLDPRLMQAADILPHEQVHVLDIDNGERLVTYAIEGAPGSGEVQINGAAAHRIGVGDRVIVVTYAEYEPAEAAAHTPRVVLVDEGNVPLRPHPAARTAPERTSATS